MHARSTDLGYIPVQPTRILDTRTGEGAGSSPCWAAGGSRLDLHVTGRGGVPDSGVAAVALNVTATDAKLGSWVAAYPAGVEFAGTSSVNVARGGTGAALTVIPVGSRGRISLMTGAGGVDLVADVVGYFPDDGSGSRFVTVDSRRLIDAPVTHTSWTQVPSGLPRDAVALVANVTTDQPQAAGYLALAPVPSEQGAPSTSTVNAAARATIANRSVTPLADGSAALYAHSGTRAIVDLNGYFAPDGAGYTALTPQRLVDTRTGLGGVPRLQGGSPVTVDVGGRAGVPVGAAAVVVTMTNDAASRWGHLSAYAADRPLPGTSDVNVIWHHPRANLAVVPLDELGRMKVALNAGSTELVLDVVGFFR